jgi:hypothetical protein
MRGRPDEGSPVVSPTKKTKGVVPRVEVIDTGGQAWELAAGEIELDVVKGARAGGRPEADLPFTEAAPTKNPIRELAQAGDRRQIGDSRCSWTGSRARRAPGARCRQIHAASEGRRGGDGIERRHG